MGYSKAPEQPQSSDRPICHSHAMTRTGVNQPPYALLHRSSPRYSLRHGRVHFTVKPVLRYHSRDRKYVKIGGLLTQVNYREKSVLGGLKGWSRNTDGL